jgi:hypothetical protein
MGLLLELTGFEYSFDMENWKPILKDFEFGNRKQSVFIRPKDGSTVKVMINGKVIDCKMMEIPGEGKP